MAKPDGTDKQDEREREARKALERVHRDSEVVGQSSLVRAAGRAREHMAGADADPEDKAELWGKRVGRALSVVAFVALAIWLIGYLLG
ncbi:MULTISPECIES: hypothetical protein [unclassified Roseitalea]|uniref:hypothetical protein n=1 Tax=unclassified Roseitalea TaxID=2639107 RepID=UPI00273FC7F2|nr:MULTISPECIES: hypothetical protein [unclassified Roseitalea]